MRRLRRFHKGIVYAYYYHTSIYILLLLFPTALVLYNAQTYGHAYFQGIHRSSYPYFYFKNFFMVLWYRIHHNWSYNCRNLGIIDSVFHTGLILLFVLFSIRSDCSAVRSENTRSLIQLYLWPKSMFWFYFINQHSVKIDFDQPWKTKKKNSKIRTIFTIKIFITVLLFRSYHRCNI